VKPLLALPLVAVEVDGAPLADTDAAALGEVRVRAALSVPAQCELSFRQPPGPLEGAAAIALGAALRVTVGESAEPLFEGEVTAVEEIRQGPAAGEVRVRAYDLAHRLRKRVHLRAIGEVTPGELARRLAGEVGLAAEADDDGAATGHLVQRQESDLELLTATAARSGLHWAVRGRTLRLMTLAGTGEEVELELGRDLHEARVERNADRAADAVEARGWRPRDGEVHHGEATSPRSGRQVAADVSAGDVGGDGRWELVDQATADDAGARALAQAELDRRAAAEVVLWAVADGDPRLRPGAAVRVTGAGGSVAGRHVLTAVTHRVDQEAGFTSELSSSPPPAPPEPAAAVLTPGVVSSVQDPDGKGRVRVTLPTFGDVETDWMQVLAVGAGDQKGFVVLPGEGDHVLVALAREDPGRGIVLGGLYGAAGPYDSGVSGSQVRRYSLRTPGGHRLTLDDEGGRLRVEDAAGSFLELAGGRVTLSSKVDIEIAAPGKRIVLRGQAIDFETA
jgi:phage protein D/phage baseplate assembly protein gpV